jgi:hypothetical protein
MTSEEHYRQAEGLVDRTDVIGALSFEQLAEAQVHATLDAEPPYLVFEYIPAGSFVTIAGTCSLKASVCRFATSSVPAAISASGGKGR